MHVSYLNFTLTINVRSSYTRIACAMPRNVCCVLLSRCITDAWALSPISNVSYKQVLEASENVSEENPSLIPIIGDHEKHSRRYKAKSNAHVPF
jgi:hypothetical protein